MRDGARWRYVHGAAARNQRFAEELAAIIDAMRACGEVVGLDARRWRRAFGDVPGDTILLPVVPKLVLAAAAGVAVEEPRRAARLGALAPIDAEGRLIATPHEVTLQVFGEKEDSVLSVTLGTVAADKPDEGVLWEVTIPFTTEPVRLLITGKGGVELEEMISFGPEDPEGQD